MFEYSLMCSLSEHLVQIYFWSDIRNIEFFWNTYQVIYAEQKLKQVTQMSCLDYKTVFVKNHCSFCYGIQDQFTLSAQFTQFLYLVFFQF